MSFDLDAFTADCIAADGLDAVTAVVTRAVEQRSAVLAAFGPIEEMSVRTLHSSSARTVQLFAWAPGMRAPAHEHRMWSVIGVCAGREDNGFWRRTATGVERTGGRAVEPGDVIALPDDVIHDVMNPLDAFTMAIHVYGGDINGIERSTWHPFTGAEQPFDVAKVERLMIAFNERQRGEAVPFAAANVPRIMKELAWMMG